LQGEPIEPNYSVREAIKGDRYLLCSDGLSNVVSMATMGDVLRDYRDPDECAERLIDLALRAGGPDNITAIVADIVAVDDSDPQAAVAHRADAPAADRPSPRPRPSRAAPPGLGRSSSSAAPADEPRRSWLATHRLTIALVVALGTLLAAAGFWYVATG
jgi:PPM family protein phosphatase